MFVVGFCGRDERVLIVVQVLRSCLFLLSCMVMIQHDVFFFFFL